METTTKQMTGLLALDKLYEYAIGKGTYAPGVSYAIVKNELEEGKKGKKFLKIIREIYANGVGIDKVFDDIKDSDSYGDFKETYPYCPKDWYDLLKEVLL